MVSLRMGLDCLEVAGSCAAVCSSPARSVLWCSAKNTQVLVLLSAHGHWEQQLRWEPCPGSKASALLWVWVAIAVLHRPELSGSWALWLTVSMSLPQDLPDLPAALFTGHLCCHCLCFLWTGPWGCATQFVQCLPGGNCFGFAPRTVCQSATLKLLQETRRLHHISRKRLTDKYIAGSRKESFAVNTLLHFVVVLLFQPSCLNIFAERLPHLNFLQGTSLLYIWQFLNCFCGGFLWNFQNF